MLDDRGHGIKSREETRFTNNDGEGQTFGDGKQEGKAAISSQRRASVSSTQFWLEGSRMHTLHMDSNICKHCTCPMRFQKVEILSREMVFHTYFCQHCSARPRLDTLPFRQNAFQGGTSTRHASNHSKSANASHQSSTSPPVPHVSPMSSPRTSSTSRLSYGLSSSASAHLAFAAY